MTFPNIDVFILKLIKMENQKNEFELQEERTRGQFVQMFRQYFKKIVNKPLFCSHDLDATGNTGHRYSIEIKERELLLKDISGNTWIEDTKLQHFEELLKNDPKLIILYFNFYPDGYISFDISSRFEHCSSEVLYVFPVWLKSTTMGTGYITQKWVGSLHANKIEYRDKIYYNGK